MSSLYLIWAENGTVLTGYDTVWLNKDLVMDINYPGNVTEAITLNVSTSAQINKTFNTLTNVKVYLTGDPVSVQIVQQLWPTLGGGYNPQRPSLNGGLEISFDNGRNYTRFDPTVGNESIPESWITLPAISIGISGQDGVLGAFDTATMIIRFTIPPGAVEYQKLNVGLALDFDII